MMKDANSGEFKGAAFVELNSVEDAA